MNRLAACLVTLLLAASAASAGNLNLRWDACFGDGGVVNKAFACNTNTGTQRLVATFFLPHDVPNATGNEIAVDIATAGATLPPWWQFRNAGACRQASLSINFVIPATTIACADWASGQASGGIASYTTPYGDNSARITAASAMPLAIEDLLAGQEYFAFNLVINNLKTVGTGACSGCSLGACIDLKALNVTTVDPRNNVQLRPGGGGLGFLDALVTWQSGTGVISGRGDCPAATPTRDRTWGDVKALYR